MSFYSRYELLNLVQDGPIKTFSARQIATGRTVGAHLFISKTPETLFVLEQTRVLGDPERIEILEIGEHEGTAFVVTNEWRRPQTFMEWITTASAQEADRFARAGNWRIPTAEFKEKSAAPGGRDTGVLPAGTFTQMFQSPARGVQGSVTGMMARPGAAPPVPEPVQPVPPAEPKPEDPEPPTPTHSHEARSVTDSGNSQEPGEFTRMFQAAGQPNPNAKGEVTRMFELDQLAAGRRQHRPSAMDDEFERLLQSDPAAKVSPMPQAMPVAPEPPAAGSPGEFTRTFQMQAQPAERSPEPPVNPQAAPQQPGEFTRMFQVPPSSPPSAPVPPPAAPPQPAAQAVKQEPGEFTRMFQIPAEPASPPARVEPPPAMTPAAPPTPAAKQEPGEFTRMFQVPATPAAPVQHQPATPPAAPPTPAAKQEPGEFTRMFQTPATPAAPVQPQPATPPAAQPAPAAQKEPGEFTRMFQTPAAPQAPPPAAMRVAPAPPPATRQEPGEFTRMFQSPVAAQQPQSPTAPPPPQQPQQQQPDAASEFARYFQTPVTNPGPAAHPAMQHPFAGAATPHKPSNAPGEFTQMFGVPSISPPPLQGGVPSYPPPQPPQQPQPKGQQEGEYTKMFMVPSAAPPAQPQFASPPPQPVQPAPSRSQPRPARKAKKPSYVPLLIVLGFVFLLAITLVLFFALRK